MPKKRFVEDLAPRRIRSQERGTIHVKHKPRPEDADWHGHAPRPVPETDRNFRPSEIKF